MAWRRSAATDQEILASYAITGSGRKVAEEVGLSIPTVYGILAKHGIERSRSKPRSDRRNGQITDNEIVEKYQEIKSGIQVAKLFGIGETTVYDTLKRRKIFTKGQDAYRDRVRSFNPEMVHELTRKYEEGLSIANIARETNVSAPTVWLYLKRAGIKTERRSRFTRIQREIVRREYLAKTSLIGIAAMIGSTEQSIRRLLRKELPDIWVEDADRKKERSPGWKGGRYVHGSDGYAYVYCDIDDAMHGMADKRGYIVEHRLVMARKINRSLRKTETVHHINGDRTDNRPENLELRQGKHGKHVVMCCLDCGSKNIGHVGLGK